jgi:hypothetical protein
LFRRHAAAVYVVPELARMPFRWSGGVIVIDAVMRPTIPARYAANPSVDNALDAKANSAVRGTTMANETGRETCPQCDGLSPGLSINERMIHCSLCHDAHVVTVEQAGRWRDEMRRRHTTDDSLFPPRAALPSRPFSLDPSPDEIRICSGCGKPIITQRRTADGQVVSEFVSAAGECFTCAHPER